MSLDAPIMLVDDDEDLRGSVGELLEDSGYDVVAYGSAAEALDDLRAGLRPRLILLDLMMPGMSGTEFLEQQRAACELADLPIVLFTAHLTPMLDGVPVLRKPFTVEALLAMVGSRLRTDA